ncbi:hypothetical protein DL546_002403 [Coniochaeta pulveracea]|uniref:Derlin n=1 Tax=Coniochaeta pulveracea TaxID=177199 RepID=A0A420Y3J4_9PEZI|nr:hypothetical protein DL546_002403 [Coniochaeta pulveracea]
MSSEILDAYWRIPPFTRTFVTATLVISIGIHFGFLPYVWFYYSTWRLFRLLPEIWRPFTSFCLTGPQIGIIFDTYWLYQYLVQLETANPRLPRKEDVLWYLLVVGSTIIALNQYFTGWSFFLHGLIIALCYTSVQDQRGQKANFFFFTVPAQAMPYCMLLSSLLMNPAIIPLQLTGIVAAHLFDFLTRIYPEFSGGPNLLPAPAFLSYFVQTPRLIRRDYGTAIRPRTGAEPSTGSTTGASGSVLPESWKTRGAGHRLGGD